MKKVVFVLPRMGLGGVERSFLGLMQYAPRQELDITLILLASGGELLEDVPEWVHIRYASAGGGTEDLRSSISEILKKLKMQRLFAFAKSVYHRVGPKLRHRKNHEVFDVAIAYSDGLATWYVADAIMAAKKVAFVHTDFLRAGYNAHSERPVYQGFETIYFGSMLSQQHFLEVLPELYLKTKLLPNCIDQKRIRLLSEERCERLESNATRLMTVSRLSPEKGLEKIPIILSKLYADGLKVHWYIIGGGSEEAHLRAEAIRLGVENSLTLLGPKKNPYPYMAQCDIYVQPSNYEGYCIALAEAKALQLPCVACSFSGAEEQIQSGITGFVSGMDASELYRSLKPLVEREDLRRVFQENLAAENPGSQAGLFVSWWQSLFE